MWAYRTYSHEYAYTMGYSHSSGLSYDCDDYVIRFITQLANENLITTKVVTREKSNVFWYLNKNDNSLVAYTQNNETFSLENNRIIFSSRLIDKIYIIDNKMIFNRLAIKANSSPSILINSDIVKDNINTGWLATYIVTSWNIDYDYDSDYYIYLGFPSKNYTMEANKSSVYFTVP